MEARPWAERLSLEFTLNCTFYLDELKLDVLINNAGIITEKSKTVDGFETQFGVNVLG